jgi:hypothetical protein
MMLLLSRLIDSIERSIAYYLLVESIVSTIDGPLRIRVMHTNALSR